MPMAVSQLLDQALENRPPIRVWPDVLEYGWIFVWGGLGLWLVHRLSSPQRYVLMVVVLGGALILGSFSYAVAMGVVDSCGATR